MSKDWVDQPYSFNEVIRQRDELLAACLAALARLDRLDDAGTGRHSQAYRQVKAAITRAGICGKAIIGALMEEAPEE